VIQKTKGLSRFSKISRTYFLAKSANFKPMTFVWQKIKDFLRSNAQDALVLKVQKNNASFVRIHMV
jgi:hypothetical protein